MKTIERGSEWRKWDLHLHTASSYDYEYRGNDADQKLVDSLIAKNISVAAITDHFVIDESRIKSLREKTSEITFFPGVELRTDKGDTNIHVILIFSDKSDLRTLCENFNVFKRYKGKNPDNDEKVYWDYNDIVKFAKDNKALISIHAGRKSNGVDQRITNSLKHNQAVKEEFIQTVDIYEMGQIRDLDDYRKNVFHSLGITKPMIICSDNHDPSTYNSSLWIKADPSFEGLRQILYEPETRICIQENKPDEKLGYNIIDSIELNNEKTWNQTIYFNQNLNTIIGGRSTGKSSLLKILYKKIEDDRETDVYLNSELENDKVKVNWVTEGNSEIEYFCQGRMHDLAENQEELNKVVRSIIKNTDNGNEILSFESKQESKKTEIIEKTASLFALNNEIYSKNENIKEIGSSIAISEEINKIKKKIEDVSGQENSEEIIKAYTSLCEELNNCQNKLKNLEIIKETLNSLQNIPDFISKDIKIKIESIDEDQDFLVDLKKDFEDFAHQIKQQFDIFLEKKLSKILELINKYSKDSELLCSNENYKKGEELKNNNVIFNNLNKNLAEENRKLAQVLILEKERDLKEKQREELLNEITMIHSSMIDEGKAICLKLKCNADNLQIKASFSMLEKQLREFYEEKFNSRVQNNLKVDEFIKKYRESSENDFIKKFVENLLNKKYTLKGSNNEQNVASDFLSRCWFSINYDIVYQKDKFLEMSPGKQAFVILKMLLDFSKKTCPILIDQPEDSLDNRAIYTELVAYLRKKKIERQIILVTHNANIVVGADAEQVIVANQNGKDSPNTGDVKFEYMTGALENSKLKDNSIKNSILKQQGIREHVCEILEGGKDAFDIREKKYGFLKNL